MNSSLRAPEICERPGSAGLSAALDDADRLSDMGMASGTGSGSIRVWAGRRRGWLTCVQPLLDVVVQGLHLRLGLAVLLAQGARLLLPEERFGNIRLTLDLRLE